MLSKVNVSKVPVNQLNLNSNVFFRTLDAQLRRALADFIQRAGSIVLFMASLLPTLPLYIQDVKQQKQQIGVVDGLFASVYCCLPWWALVDSTTQPKIALLIGTGYSDRNLWDTR